MPGIREIKFGRLDVTEITYGYYIKAKYGKEGAKHWDPTRSKYFGRNMTTEGFSFYLDDSIFNNALQIATQKNYSKFIPQSNSQEELVEIQNNLRQAVMHTLKHALLSRLPYLIGLEPNKVSGSYDFVEVSDSERNTGAKNVVYIYDSEMGGTGATKTLFEDQLLLLRWLDSARYAVRNCPSGSCKNGFCRRCLYIENCGEINLNLNRYLASPIFFDTNDLDWVNEC